MKYLFDSTNIKSMKLKNRLFKSGSWEGLATEDSHMTDDLFKVYEELAKGGVGTIATGYAHVEKNEQPAPNMMGIYDDSFIPEYKELTDMVHSYGANIIMQITYGGTRSHLDKPSSVIYGASPVKNQVTGIVPKEIGKDEIRNLVKSFGKAAARVKKSGFDAVQIHAAHGYFLSQFLCPYYNRRNDEYGGSIENRARIIIEIYHEIRAQVGDDYPILIKFNSEDFMEDGLTSEDSIAVSKMLEEAGIDAIEVSGGNDSALYVVENNLDAIRKKVAFSTDKQSYFKNHAEKLAKVISIPVILTGGNRDINVMNDILNNTNIEYFGLCRTLIREPGLINEWKDGDNKTPKCISCNQCLNTYGKRCIFNLNK